MTPRVSDALKHRLREVPQHPRAVLLQMLQHTVGGAEYRYVHWPVHVTETSRHEDRLPPETRPVALVGKHVAVDRFKIPLFKETFIPLFEFEESGSSEPRQGDFFESFVANTTLSDNLCFWFEFARHCRSECGLVHLQGKSSVNELHSGARSASVGSRTSSLSRSSSSSSITEFRGVGGTRYFLNFTSARVSLHILGAYLAAGSGFVSHPRYWRSLYVLSSTGPHAMCSQSVTRIAC